MKKTAETRKWLSRLENNYKAWKILEKSVQNSAKEKDGGSKKAKKRKASKNNELMMFRGYMDFKESLFNHVSKDEKPIEGQWERFV